MRNHGGYKEMFTSVDSISITNNNVGIKYVTSSICDKL